ncbi:MAG: hypothetical protein F4W91_04315 [Gemmatimonadetes bacterium]|nr:hypothetical protein [Gemmatimonadota bacterium]
MAISTPIDVPESCPTIAKKPENVQRELWEAFETAIVKAQKQGIPEEEIFQFLENVIDNRAADQAVKEMEQIGKKPIPWEKVKKEAGL